MVILCYIWYIHSANVILVGNMQWDILIIYGYILGYIWDVSSGKLTVRYWKSPSWSSVNPLFLWAIFYCCSYSYVKLPKGIWRNIPGDIYKTTYIYIYICIYIYIIIYTWLNNVLYSANGISRVYLYLELGEAICLRFLGWSSRFEHLLYNRP